MSVATDRLGAKPRRRRANARIGHDPAESPLKRRACPHPGRQHGLRRGRLSEELHDRQECAGVAARFVTQPLEHEGVAAELLRLPQLPLRPPHDRVPPGDHARDPLQPAHEMIVPSDVSQLVREDPAQLVPVHPDGERPRDDDPDPPAHPPGHRRHACARQGDVGHRPEAKDRGDLRGDPDDVRRRRRRRPLEQTVEPADPKDRRHGHDRASDSPDEHDGTGTVSDQPGQWVETLDSGDRRAGRRRPLCWGEGAGAGRSRRTGQDGQQEERRRDRLHEDDDPEPVRETRVPAAPVDQVGEPGKNGREQQVAERDLAEEAGQPSPPGRWPSLSRMRRRRSISAGDRRSCSRRWVTRGASEPPVRRWASDSSSSLA